MLEIWKDVVGYEGHYRVSQSGRIVSIKNGGWKVLTPDVIRSGYERIHLHKEATGRKILVHRIVAEAFIGPCPHGKQCNHIDGNKRNNNLANLEWVTSSENQLHAIRIGKKPPTPKIKWYDVPVIVASKVFLNDSEIGEVFGVNRKTVGRVLKNQDHYRDRAFGVEK